MQYNLSIIEKLWQKYCYKDSQGLKSDRKQIIKDYADITGIDIPEATLKHYVKRLDRERLYAEKYGKVASTEVTKQIVSPKSELDINQDGTHKLLVYSKMISNQSKDPNYVMDTNGHPSDLWELVNLRVNEWGSTTNPDNQYYQIRLTVKPKTIDGLSMDDINQLMITSRTPIKPIAYEVKQTDKSMALMITDKHVGLSIVNDELFKQIIEQARLDAISNDVEHIYLYNL